MQKISDVIDGNMLQEFLTELKIKNRIPEKKMVETLYQKGLSYEQSLDKQRVLFDEAIIKLHEEYAAKAKPEEIPTVKVPHKKEEKHVQT